MVHKVRSENGDLCVKVEKMSSEHAIKVEKVRSDVVELCDRFEKVSSEHAVKVEKVRSDVAELCDKVEKMSGEHSVKVEKVPWSEVAELWDRVEKMSSEHAVEVEKVWSVVAELRDRVEKVSNEHAKIRVGVEKVISENAEMRAMQKNKSKDAKQSVTIAKFLEEFKLREDKHREMMKALKDSKVEDDAKAHHKKLEHAMEEIGRDYCKTDTMRLELLKENADLKQKLQLSEEKLQLSEEQKEETEESNKGKQIEVDQLKTALEFIRESSNTGRESFGLYAHSLINKIATLEKKLEMIKDILTDEVAED
nr:hypothetical protein Iba_chr03eCG3890 [Ipomoea batatas]